MPGFRLGIHVFKDTEIVDFTSPYGVWSVARRYDAEVIAYAAAYDVYRHDLETLRPSSAL
jgi:hypothetical protein